MNNKNKMEGSGEFRYFAFISYSSKDLRWGKRLQRKLEGFRMPATLCSERGWKRKPMDPTFFAPYDIQPGDLSEEIKSRLRASRNLIVVCSPASAQSEWVGNEIAYFHELGRDKDIYFFIIEGVPHSGDPATECFNPITKELDIPEILGVNIHEKIFRWSWMNRERAYLQLISKMLGVEFDTLWRRHRRRMIRNAVLWSVGCVAVAAAFTALWLNMQPVDVSVSLNEASEPNAALPPLHDAAITLSVGDETKKDTIRSLGGVASFVNIPHKYLGKEAHITLLCEDYFPVDTVVTLTKDITVNVRRDPAVYGDLRAVVFDTIIYESVPDIDVTIGRWNLRSDAEGVVRLTVPLSEQQRSYEVTVPSRGVTTTLQRPGGEEDLILVK